VARVVKVNEVYYGLFLDLELLILLDFLPLKKELSIASIALETV